MTKEELTSRIEKSKEKIAKIEKRIAKWTLGMNEEAKAIVAACELLYDDPKLKSSYETYKEYEKIHENDPTVFNPNDWNKGPQLGEAYRAYRDLAETKNTLHKYETALNKLINFDNAEKIEVIWSFLQAWKKEIKEWIIDGCELFGRLKAKYSEAWKEYSESENYREKFDSYLNKKWPEWRIKYQIEDNFKEKYYSEVPALSKTYFKRPDSYDDIALEKFLDAEVRARYNDLVKRITEKAGEIVSADNLYIGRNGQINGIVNGTKNNVRVETIPAGGYNIQKFHYRTLVHVI